MLYTERLIITLGRYFLGSDQKVPFGDLFLDCETKLHNRQYTYDMIVMDTHKSTIVTVLYKDKMSQHKK